MGRVIARNVVSRKTGYLYYVDGKGNVCEAKMSRGGRKKKATARRRTAVRRRTAARRRTVKRKR
jgi:hypothetical protein